MTTTMDNWCHPICMYVRMYIFTICIRHLTLHTYVCIVRSLNLRSDTEHIGIFSLLTLCILSMQPSRFCPLLPPLCWLHNTPHPTHYFSAYQGPLMAERVSVMVLLASSKCLETFFLVVKHCILTKWPFCDLLVVLKFHRWKAQWLHRFNY